MIRSSAHHLMTTALLCAVVAIPAIGASEAHGKTWIVCPMRSSQRDCELRGNLAIQSAIDGATDGDTIRIKSGIYVPQKLRDVPFADVVLRTFLVVERKSLRLIADSGAVLDGRVGPPATAMVLKDARVEISNLTVRNFRVQQAEDDIYDGHGIFIIDSRATLNDVTFERNQKMSLSARGVSDVTATGLRMHDGHVGVWVRESAQLRLCNSIIINNDGLGAGAAANGSLRVYNTVLGRNADDGLYAKEDAVVFATNSIITGNRPFGARAEGGGQVCGTASCTATIRRSAHPTARSKSGLGSVSSISILVWTVAAAHPATRLQRSRAIPTSMTARARHRASALRIRRADSVPSQRRCSRAAAGCVTCMSRTPIPVWKA